MSCYVPVIINPNPTEHLGLAFGVSLERFDAISRQVSIELGKVLKTDDGITSAGLCKVFVEQATTDSEAIMLAFMAGKFLKSGMIESEG